MSLKVVDADKVLSDVPEHYMAFWFNSGRIAKNIYEFLSSVESCPEEVFRYHVNKEKNDFASWVRDILGDELLSKRLASELDQKKAAAKIRKRIKELEKLRK